MSKTDNLAIKVSGISKTFKLPHEKQSSLKGLFLNIFKPKRTYEQQQVLENVSFEINKGEFFGIVGRNGSGKSTLLKILAGIYAPDSGSVEVNGKLTPFIELGVGFNPELTGKENVFLNGALLGFSREDISSMYDEIVEFAELEKFMDQKLKNYSSGMQVRLAFSIAIRANTDILVLDEVLAVGDEAFQRKCNLYFDQVKKDKSKTVILVTHSMDAVRKYCEKAVLIQNGSVIVSGDPNDVANRYSEENTKGQVEPSLRKNKNNELGLNDQVPVLNNKAISSTVLTYKDTFKFRINYEFNGSAPFFIAFSLIDLKRGGIPYDSDAISVKKTGKGYMDFSLPMKHFNDSDFQIISSLRILGDGGVKNTIAFTSQANSCFFMVRNNSNKSSYALLRHL